MNDVLGTTAENPEPKNSQHMYLEDICLTLAYLELGLGSYHH